MATVSKLKEFSNNIVRDVLAGNVYSVEVTVDSASEGLATGNVYKVLELAPNAIIHNCQSVINTAEGATCTLDIGLMGDDITDDPNSLDDAVNGNAAAGTKAFSVAGTDPGIGLNLGASGGFITVSVDNAMDTGIFTITALVSQSDNA